MRKYLVVSFLLAMVIACQEEVTENTVKHPDEIHNPNGDSELALVMRRLHFEAGEVKVALEAGKNPDLAVLKELAAQIATATPTEGNNFDSSFYDFSRVINEKVTELEHSSSKAIEFNAIVSTCVSCHQTTCPGPIKKIKKLNLPV